MATQPCCRAVGTHLCVFTVCSQNNTQIQSPQPCSGSALHALPLAHYGSMGKGGTGSPVAAQEMPCWDPLRSGFSL